MPPSSPQVKNYNMNTNLWSLCFLGPGDVNASNAREDSLTNKVKKEQPKLSRIDFVGFGFTEKKRYRGMPPGLAPVVETFGDGEIPEVEIIVGDASNIGITSPQSQNSFVDADNSDLYKPKVSTWGVFPRPSNISKTVKHCIFFAWISLTCHHISIFLSSN